MATSSVGVTKKRVRVIDNDSSTYSAEYEQDVYVVDTIDATLQLQTGTEAAIDLTGDTQISTDSGATANIGSNTSSNTTNILARTVNIGDSTGGRNIYIGHSNESSSSTISIGSQLTEVTIGQPDTINGSSGSTKLHNRTIQIGKMLATTAPSNSGSLVAIDSDSLSTVSKSTHTSRAVGTLKLVGSNDTLADTGGRSQVLISTSLTQNSYSSDGSDAGSIQLSSTSIGSTLSTTDSSMPRTLYSSSVSRDLAMYETHTYYWANQSTYAAGSALNNTGSSEVTLSNPKAAGIELVGNPYSTNEPSIYLRTSPNHHIELHAGSSQLNTPASTNTQGSKLKLQDASGALQVIDSSNNVRGLSEVTGLYVKQECSNPFTNTKSISGITPASADSYILNSSDNSYFSRVSQLLSGADATCNVYSNNDCNVLANSTILISASNTATTTTEGTGERSYVKLEKTHLREGLNTSENAYKTRLEHKKTVIDNVTSYEINAFAENSIDLVSQGSVTLWSSATANSTNGTITIGAGARGSVVISQDSIVLSVVNSDNSMVSLGGYTGAFNNRFYSSTGFHSGAGGGTGASAGYAPFTGVHIFDIMENETIEVGDTVELVNKQARRAASSMSKICVGLAISINNNKVEVAAVGDTECGDLKGFKVCDENGSITAGDLLVTSSRPGYLMKQSDDIVRSITIGKSVVDVQFDQSGLATDIYGFIYCG